jgi:hypothetical protein
MEGLVQKIRKVAVAPLPPGYSAEWGVAVRSMLRRAPGDRPGVDTLLTHAFMQTSLRSARARAVRPPSLCVSLCVSLTVSPSPAPLSLCLPLCLPLCLSHCVSLTGASLTVSPSVSPSPPLSLCLPRDDAPL